MIAASFSINWCFLSLDSKWLQITTSTFQRFMNRASVSDINRKDCMNHSILDAGLIVYHTPHQLAVTTLPLPPRHRVRLTNTDSSGLELEVVVCTEVWNFRYIDRFLLDVHFTNRGGDTLDRPFKECFSNASIYLIGKPIICFVKIKIKPNCNISTNNNGLVDEVSVPEV